MSKRFYFEIYLHEQIIYLNKLLSYVIVNIYQDVVTGMRYGRFGREDGTLVMATKGRDVKHDFVLLIPQDFVNL